MNVTDTQYRISARSKADGWPPQQRIQAEIKTVSVCDTQPVTAEGIRTLLNDSQACGSIKATDSLARARDILRDPRPRC